jgi:hypothetical protein
VRGAQGCPVQSHAATVHLDNAGFSCAVAPPPRWGVHPCWAWGNAVTRQPRTRQRRKFIWKCWSRCAPRPSHP